MPDLIHKFDGKEAKILKPHKYINLMLKTKKPRYVIFCGRWVKLGVLNGGIVDITTDPIIRGL